MGLRGLLIILGAVPVTEPTQKKSIPPYRLEFLGGYTSFQLGPLGKLGERTRVWTGPHYGFRLGRVFEVHPRHSFFVHGIFRHALLKNDSLQKKLSLFHFGLEGGYEIWLAPQILSLYLFTGLGANVLDVASLDLGEGISSPVNHRMAQAFDFGGGLSLARRTLVFHGGYQPKFRFKVPDPEGTNTDFVLKGSSYFFQAGLDLAALIGWAGGKFAKPDWNNFSEGLRLGFTLDGSYTYNFRKPADHRNPLRTFNRRDDRPILNLAQFSLVRESEEKSPMGWGIVLDTGENTDVSGANASLNGDYYDLQQFWGEIRLPLGKGLTLRGGKFATFIGYEVLEPTNNQIERSWAFGLGIPFTHGGLTASYPFSKKVSLKLGLVNGWDNVFGRESSPTGLAGIFTRPTERFSLSFSGAAGAESGRPRTLLDSVATLAKNNFSLSFNFDWGHEGRGSSSERKSHWIAASLNPRYDFHHIFSASGRAELFHDPQGARSGDSQTLGSGALTLHFRPVPKRWFRYFPLELRAEVRHDAATAPSFLANETPVGSQTTFAVGATLRFTCLTAGKRDT